MNIKNYSYTGDENYINTIKKNLINSFSTYNVEYQKDALLWLSKQVNCDYDFLTKIPLKKEIILYYFNNINNSSNISADKYMIHKLELYKKDKDVNFKYLLIDYIKMYNSVELLNILLLYVSIKEIITYLSDYKSLITIIINNINYIKEINKSISEDDYKLLYNEIIKLDIFDKINNLTDIIIYYLKNINYSKIYSKIVVKIYFNYSDKINLDEFYKACNIYYKTAIQYFLENNFFDDNSTKVLYEDKASDFINDLRNLSSSDDKYILGKKIILTFNEITCLDYKLELFENYLIDLVKNNNLIINDNIINYYIHQKIKN
jgi:hypothetical protein